MEPRKQWISPEELFSAILEVLREGRQARFTVTGMSMWPFLCHGRDSVVLEAAAFETLRRGDVVLLQTPLGNYMLHRVTGLRPDGFETTGDGNCFRDGWFSPDCLRARAVAFERPGCVIRCASPLWRGLAAAWGLLFPVRKYIFWFWRRLRPLVRR